MGAFEIKTIIFLAVFIFLEGVFLSLAFTDNATTGINVTSPQLNFSGNPNTNDLGVSGIGNALRVMLTFSVSDAQFPQVFAVFISFFNWLIFITIGVCIYRIVNPFA